MGTWWSRGAMRVRSWRENPPLLEFKFVWGGKDRGNILHDNQLQIVLVVLTPPESQQLVLISGAEEPSGGQGWAACTHQLGKVVSDCFIQVSCPSSFQPVPWKWKGQDLTLPTSWREECPSSASE